MAASGYSGLFNGTPDVNGGGTSGHTLLQGTENTDGNYRPPFRGRVSKLMRKTRSNMRVLNELMQTLIGTAAGSSAADSYKRVQGVAALGDLGSGGAVPIATRTMVSRVTTAADVTELKKLFTDDSKPTYVVDASGNGGGGKVGV